MITIGKALVSEELLTEHFLCDLAACKGGCCADGDAGAPLDATELSKIDDVYEKVASQLSEQARQAIQQKGRYTIHEEHGWVTPCIGEGVCVYAMIDQAGCIHCAFQKAYQQGTIKWEKPLSCHLYPIKITKTATYDLVNFLPRKRMCQPACVLGKEKKVPVYQFVKKALIRKYGLSFYNELHAVATQHPDFSAS